MRIQVTQEHIDKGKRSDCYECPIALALNDAFPRTSLDRMLNTTKVFRDHFIVGGKGSYSHTRGMRKFVRNFDGGMRVKPFYFYMKA